MATACKHLSWKRTHQGNQSRSTSTVLKFPLARPLGFCIKGFEQHKKWDLNLDGYYILLYIYMKLYEYDMHRYIYIYIDMHTYSIYEVILNIQYI